MSRPAAFGKEGDDVHFDHHLTSQVAKEEKKGPTTVIINSSGITTAMLKDCNSTIEC